MNTLNKLADPGADRPPRATVQASVNAAPAPAPACGTPELGLTIGLPLLGVTASFSPQGLQALAGAAGDLAQDAAGQLGRAGASVLEGGAATLGRLAQGVGDGASAVVQGALDLGESAVDAVGDVVGEVAGYGAMAVLAGGALLDELI